MNKTLITISILTLVAIMFIGIIIIAALKPDSLDRVIPLMASTLGSVVTLVVLIHGLGKTNEKVDKIEKNTNGINSALMASALGRTEDTIERWKYPEKETEESKG